ncbi:acyl-CoA thioesterase [Brevundimonas sp.]|uniref:acyl-CoA thioesterase n=1 Tax=Brevundimonas sp. TaxID=1871086 RepID=UPI00289CBA55|nr:acyl-CoA thioesterase [Brevundimonas sp.]
MSRRIGCGASGLPLYGEIDALRRFRTTFRARADDIDELDHVNNAVWVDWAQEASMAHWFAAARGCDRDRYVAMVLKHEIEYRGNIRVGEDVTALTWVEGPPRGARYTRCVEFVHADGRRLVIAISQWALIDRSSGRPVRVPFEVAAPFLRDDSMREVVE